MPQPILTTQRFELWQPQPGDLADLFDLTIAEETRRFLGTFVPTEMDAFARLLRKTMARMGLAYPPAPDLDGIKIPK